MNIENSLFLSNKYNDMLNDAVYLDTSSSFCFSFDCGDGWFDIIDNMLSEINNYCEDLNIEKPKISQIKEKFGSLRCYYFLNASIENHNYIDKIINMYHNMSTKTCERCGSCENVSQTKGFILTLCKKCKENREKTK